MRRLIFGIVIILPVLTTAQSAPAEVVFVSEPQTISVEAISETITIQARDGSGTALKLPTTGCLALSSSANGEFSSNVSNWNAVSVLTMNKGTASRSFYYKSNTAGTHTLTARLVLKPEAEERSCASWPIGEWSAGWTATQDITIGSGATPPPSEQKVPAPSSGSTNAPSEPMPSLLIKIIGPTQVSVGADATFSAQVFGVKKEPIPNARVLWGLGNGATKEGTSVRYTYNIPGTYVVIADAASGGLAGTARLVVNAVKPSVHIVQAVSGLGGFVEIENRGGMELDVSGWGITSGATLFSIPARTVLLQSSKVAFPASVTGVFVVGHDARLLFPNGAVAAEYVALIQKEPVPPEVAGQNPPPSVPPPLVKEGGGGGFYTSDTPAAVSLSLSDEKPVDGLGPWLWGVAGIGVLGVGALAAFRFKPAFVREENEEKEFAHKVRIV